MCANVVSVRVGGMSDGNDKWAAPWVGFLSDLLLKGW